MGNAEFSECTRNSWMLLDLKELGDRMMVERSSRAESEKQAPSIRGIPVIPSRASCVLVR